MSDEEKQTPALPVTTSKPKIARTRRTPPKSLLVFVPVLMFAAAAGINGHTVLDCTRDEHNGGECVMRRGSLALEYDESFPVSELAGAEFRATLPVPLADGPVWIVTTGDAFRFIDAGAWSERQRRDAMTTVNAFAKAKGKGALHLEADRRPVFFAVAAAMSGALVGLGLWMARRRERGDGVERV